MSVLVVPLLSGLAVAGVIALSALYQRYQFRRTGDPPIFTARHVLTYGAATLFSSLLSEFWNPPLWQKLLIFVVVFGAGLGVLRLFGKFRRP
jgi:cell division protein FtsW (lipid II flippase)